MNFGWKHFVVIHFQQFDNTPITLELVLLYTYVFFLSCANVLVHIFIILEENRPPACQITDLVPEI